MHSESPDWTPGSTHLFYDGDCGVCHWAVRWVVQHDRRAVFRYAPLTGPTFGALVALPAPLPDSLVVRTAAGEVLVRSRAVIHILAQLGNGWHLLGQIFRLCPTPLADFFYDRFARVRHRLAPRPNAACPLLPPALARRFDP